MIYVSVYLFTYSFYTSFAHSRYYHEELEVTQAPRGIRVLRAVGGSVNGSDASHGRLRETVDGVREVLQDDPR